MKKILLFLTVSLFVSFPANADRNQSQKVVLDNGMVVLVHPMPASPVISVYGFVKTGSATEGKYLGTGISHFAEHMLFKGTKKRALGVIAQEVKALGGSINASTSHDYTIYTLDLPEGHLKDGLDIMADMLMNATFDKQEVDREREVIFGEMRMINDRPERKLGDLVYRTVYLRHPYKHPIIGYVPLFGDITRDDLVEYYQEKYIPNNIILSVAGHVNSEEVINLAKDYFKDFKQRPYPQRNLPVELEQVMPRKVDHYYPSDLIRFSMAYQGVSISDQDMYALDVLAMALGQGESTPFYKEIYERKRLVDGITSSNYTPLDRGFFEIEATLSKDHVYEAVDEIKKIIDAIKKKGITRKELDKTKRQVLSQTVFGRQTASSMAYKAALEEAMVGDYQFSQKYLDEVRKVTIEDIKRVAQRYLNDRYLTLAIFWPETFKELAKEKDNQQTIKDFEKIVLPNGLELLLKEEHALPIVSLSVVMNGGSRYETVENTGISELVSKLWVKGTTSKSSTDIAQLIEEKGASLEGFSGKNSMGIRSECLSEDLDFFVDLIEDIIKNPSFPEHELQIEKEKLKVGIKGREDSIFQFSFKQLLDTLFLQHPFRFDSLGTVESIDRIKRQDMIKHYERFALPNNAIISVAGDFDSAKVKEVLVSKFAQWKNGEIVLQKFHEDPPNSPREKNFYKDKEQAAVLIGFYAPDFYDSDRYGMEVLASIFGSSLTGRLFTKVREELGKAYTLGASYSPAADAGIMFFWVLTTDEYADQIKDLIFKEISLIGQEGATDDELMATKNNLKGTFKMSLDTISEVSFTSTLNELYHFGYDYHLKYDQFIDSVTGEQIKELAKKYLDINRAVIVVTRPSLDNSSLNEEP